MSSNFDGLEPGDPDLDLKPWFLLRVNGTTALSTKPPVGGKLQTTSWYKGVGGSPMFYRAEGNSAEG